MKTTKKWIIGLTTAAILAFLAAGCEDADTGSAMSVTPETSNLSGQGATVVLTAKLPGTSMVSNRSDQIILPLSWSVSNPSLGGILSSRGYTAVYESNGKDGQNVVIAEDAYGHEGLAVINQD